jgi:hypothetical protein
MRRGRPGRHPPPSRQPRQRPAPSAPSAQAIRGAPKAVRPQALSHSGLRHPPHRSHNPVQAGVRWQLRKNRGAAPGEPSSQPRGSACWSTGHGDLRCSAGTAARQIVPEPGAFFSLPSTRSWPAMVAARCSGVLPGFRICLARVYDPGSPFRVVCIVATFGIRPQCMMACQIKPKGAPVPRGPVRLGWASVKLRRHGAAPWAGPQSCRRGPVVYAEGSWHPHVLAERFAIPLSAEVHPDE